MPNSEDRVEEKCLDLVKSVSEDVDEKRMKDALFAIAQELQRFRTSDSSEVDEEVNMFQSKLRMKRKKIKSLKENLNTACIIARTVMSAKENECYTLNKRLSLAKNESAIFLKKNVKNLENIRKLSKENHALNERLSNLANFIELGFHELKKMRNEQTNELSIELQLKEIMVSCGQYYADYYNEHEKCIQLEQRNRFLTNKVHILETNLDTISEELKLQKNQRVPDNKNFVIANMKNIKYGTGQKLRHANSEYDFQSQKSLSQKSNDLSQKLESTKNHVHTRASCLDLSSHITLVNHLLSDQDLMLKDLKKITRELNQP